MATLSAGRGWLNDDAAASLHRMDAERGAVIPLTDAGRTNAEQWALWNRWQAGGTYNRPPYLYQPAYPGSSPHEAGNAIDVGNNDARNWVINNGGRHGWRRNIASDVVHFIYEVWNDAYAGGGTAPAGGSSAAGALSLLGTDYVIALQTQLGVEADGIAGPITITALQTRVGAIIDGEWGPDSLTNTQAFVGAVADGIWGPETLAKFRAAIDAGKFGTSGTSDPEVLEAQKLLNAVGYGLVEDGVKGPLTLAAIQDFQTKYGLEVDGIAGPATKAKLREVAANPQPPVDPPTDPGYPAGYYRPAPLPAGTLLGIDVARYQAGFDFAAYKAGAREDFVFLKRGGSNVPTYLDSQYAVLLAAARAAGFDKLGHYWFNGRANGISPADSARAFLLGPDGNSPLVILPGEVVALDIESEPATETAHYTAAEALEWLHVVEAALGIKPFVYMSASVARQQQWAAVKAEGYPLWVAMYTYNPGPKAGTYEPNDVDPLNAWGAGDAWTIHQWTSTVHGKMPGWSGTGLDRNIAKPDAFAKYGFVAYPEPVEPDPGDGVNLDEARAIAARIQTDAADLAAVLTPAGT